jgi:hypothetical protein
MDEMARFIVLQMCVEASGCFSLCMLWQGNSQYVALHKRFQNMGLSA